MCHNADSGDGLATGCAHSVYSDEPGEAEKRRGQGWRDGGKEEGVETVQLVMCSCLRGWIRPRSLASGGGGEEKNQDGG